MTQVASALTDEIRRLAGLVDEFERPFHPDPLVLNTYKKVNFTIVVITNTVDSFTTETLSFIKHKKLTSLQHRVRATKSHIQNSTNHFSGIM